jgi:hypothetical protein
MFSRVMQRRLVIGSASRMWISIGRYRLDGIEPADIEVEVSHYMALPWLPNEAISAPQLDCSESAQDVFERTESHG